MMNVMNVLSTVPNLLAQYGGSARYGGESGLEGMATGLLVVFVLLGLGVAVLMIAAWWCIFTKAGQPGWAAIIPFYNMYVLLQVAGKPGWWLIWFILPALPIPIVNVILSIVSVIFTIIVWAAVCERFGKGGGFVVGVILLGVIFIPILGFGSAQYRPAMAAATATPPLPQEEQDDSAPPA